MRDRGVTWCATVPSKTSSRSSRNEARRRALVVLSSSSGRAAQARTDRLMISVDGLRPDYVTAPTRTAQDPALRRFSPRRVREASSA